MFRHIAAAALAGLLGCGAAQAATTVPGGNYGTVSLFKPAGEMQGFVVLFSDAAGWRPSDQKAGETLARNGAMVVGVDTARYAQTLATVKESCHNLLGDAEAMAHQLQREARSDRYMSPILAGTGQGATLARLMLARAPANTAAGAIVIDPAAKLDARFNPCPADSTISRGKGLPGFLESGSALSDASGSDKAPLRHFAPGTSSADMMSALAAAHLRPRNSGEEDVSDLPLIELPAAQASDMLAVVISGDGGWRDLDKSIAENLQRRGIPVIGVDSLRYFWSVKTPQQTSRDIARVLQTYSSRWHTRHIALIGYSFGADVMPFVYNRLPEALRARVSYVSLLGFAPNADFQIRVTGWLGMPASDKALPAVPEVRKMPPAIVQCVYGKDEDDSACPALVHTGVTLLRTDGGHHFGKDYDALASAIVDGWRRQIAAHP